MIAGKLEEIDNSGNSVQSVAFNSPMRKSSFAGASSRGRLVGIRSLGIADRRKRLSTPTI
jgi:hypothetical protein